MKTVIYEKELVELAKRAVQTWGFDAQVNMMIEECAEVIQVLIKRERKINNRGLYEIVGELVDLEIMLTQMKVMFPSPFWLDIRYRKIKRLKKLLDNAKV